MALAQRGEELGALREQLASGASTSDALKAATDRAEQMAQQLQALETKLREQSSRAAEAVKVRSCRASMTQEGAVGWSLQMQLRSGQMLVIMTL